MPKDTTGYDPEPSEEPNYFHYTVDQMTITYAAGSWAQVSRNGVVIGSLRCEDDEEFKWLKKVLTKTRENFRNSEPNEI